MPSHLTPALLLVVTVACLLLVRAKRLSIQVAVETALILTLGAWLIDVGTSPIPLDGRIAQRPDGPWLQAVAVTWWLSASRLVVTATSLLRGRATHSGGARLASDLFAGGIYLTASFIILNTVLALPIRGLLATSGVIAIVVGLALQSTLADLFSGIAFGIEQSFRVGDLISIEGTTEGTIIQMNWRSIHLSTADADVATIPNSIIAKSRITNRSKPSDRRTITTDLHVRYAGPANRLMELVRQTPLLCPTIMSEPPPAAAIAAAKGKRLIVTVAYSISRSELMLQARGELIQNFRRMVRHAAPDATNAAVQKFLGEISLFEALTAAQIQRIEEALSSKELEKGDRLFAAGSEGTCLYIVRRGVLEIIREEDGAARSLGRIGPGEWIGDVSMMTGEPQYVSVDALTPTTILELSKGALQAMLIDDPKLGRRLQSSVRRGMELVERDVAARTSMPMQADPGLLDRIKHFLRC